MHFGEAYLLQLYYTMSHFPTHPGQADQRYILHPDPPLNLTIYFYSNPRTFPGELLQIARGVALEFFFFNDSVLPSSGVTNNSHFSEVFNELWRD